MRFSRTWLALLLSCATPLGAQTTLFTTEDFRKDQARWADPAYYLDNTARELTDMQVDHRFGQKGTAADKYAIRSPYPFQSAQEHYAAWLEKAKGGSTHTLATLPNWDGVWTVRGGWLDSVDIQASTLAAAMTPQYREYYVQMAKGEAEGRHWWASSFCLPEGFVRGVSRGPRQFVTRPGQVLFLTDTNVSTDVRWVYTDRGHRPEPEQYPRWLGESIGFWDGNALVVHTNQIRQWTASHSLFEWSDQMTAVERYERVGDDIVGEVTLYDPVAFLYPLHARLRFTPAADDRMVASTCTDTNGPSSNIYAGPDGIVNERVPGDPAYWDPNDPRPWATHFTLGERRSGR